MARVITALDRKKGSAVMDHNPPMAARHPVPYNHAAAAAGVFMMQANAHHRTVVSRGRVAAVPLTFAAFRKAVADLARRAAPVEHAMWHVPMVLCKFPVAALVSLPMCAAKAAVVAVLAATVVAVVAVEDHKLHLILLVILG